MGKLVELSDVGDEMWRRGWPSSCLSAHRGPGDEREKKKKGLLRGRTGKEARVSGLQQRGAVTGGEGILYEIGMTDRLAGRLEVTVVVGEVM